MYDVSYYQKNKKQLDVLVENEKTLLFLELLAGMHSIDESQITIENTVLGYTILCR